MTDPAISLEQVHGTLGRLRFLRTAAALRAEPQFTPDVSLDFLRQTSPRNPVFRHAKAAFFIAKRGGRVVGRICACVDREINERHHQNYVHFGFFEIAEGEVAGAGALVDAAAAFGRSLGATSMRGPIDLNLNYKTGCLIDGFERPPAIMMNWNPPYYSQILEACGLEKEIDLVSFEVDQSGVQLERYEKLAGRALARGGFQLRTFELQHFDRELGFLRNIYNQSWAGNWGFTPAGQEELRYEAVGLKQIIRPELGFFIEKDGAPVAFSLSIPDMAVAIREVRGRLFPLGWWHLLKRVRTIPRARMLLLGVLPAYQRQGLDALLYIETARRGIKANIYEAEFGWILENNTAMIRGCEACGAKITKRYRIYRKGIL